jgi:transmembrane sensor
MVSEDIIVKCLAGEADQHELALLEQWRNASADNEKMYQQIVRLWEHSANTEKQAAVNTEAAWQRVQQKIQQPSTKVVKWPVKWLAAASVVLLIGVGVFLFRSQEKTIPLSTIKSTTQKQIVLKDGSEITLLKGEFQYPEKFDAQKRLVYLKSGTAYFKIHKDSLHPFEIQCAKTSVTVLGTAFEIKQDNQHTYVSVNEGKVRFTTPSGTSILTAGMFADYNAANQSLNTSAGFSKNQTAYATRQLSYNGSSVQTVVNDLKRFYPSFTMTISPTIAQCKISGDYNLEEGLENILLVLAATLNAELDFSEKQHTASIKGGMCTP